MEGNRTEAPHEEGSGVVCVSLQPTRVSRRGSVVSNAYPCLSQDPPMTAPKSAKHGNLSLNQTTAFSVTVVQKCDLHGDL